MSKLIIIVAAVLVLGAGVYFAVGRNNSPESANEGVMMQEEDGVPQDEGAVNSLRNLLTSNVSQTCTFTSNDDDYPGGGTVYVSGGNMRGDFETTYEGETKSSHMIVADETAYVWTDDEAQGFKMAFGDEELQMAEEYSSSMTKSGFDLDANVDYSCTPGAVNNSLFTVPSGVNFVDATQMMQEVTEDLSSQCSACDSLSGDAKNQCLAALNCN